MKNGLEFHEYDANLHFYLIKIVLFLEAILLYSRMLSIFRVIAKPAAFEVSALGKIAELLLLASFRCFNEALMKLKQTLTL